MENNGETMEKQWRIFATMTTMVSAIAGGSPAPGSIRRRRRPAPLPPCAVARAPAPRRAARRVASAPAGKGVHPRGLAAADRQTPAPAVLR